MEKELDVAGRTDGRPRSTPAPRDGFRVGRIVGIEVRIDVSWLAIAFVIVVSFVGRFSMLLPEASPPAIWAGAILTALAFFASILVHEISHCWVARARGMEIEGVTLFMFGGISRIRGEPKRPRDEFWMAAVGPATSAVLGLLFLLGARLMPEGSMAESAVGWLGWINLVLAAFNLLPGYPLDGGRIFRSGVWAMTRDLRKATRWAARLGSAIGIGLVVWGLFVLLTTPNFISGLWLALIGWFLVSAAQRSAMGLEVRHLLGRYRVRDAMRADCPLARPGDNLKAFVDEKVLGTGHRCFVVTEDGVVRGLLTVHELRSAPREEWDRRTVADVMIPLSRIESVAPSDSLAQALELMEARGVNQVPVIEDGVLRGLVRREDLLHVISTDLEIKGAPA